jgi:crotonobetainyl-CoA:carnitine CoA-transferase CaiB-like acyl-CoA transferase
MPDSVRESARALTGCRVLEAGEGIVVPYAGGLLAGLGAEVVKVEPPAGDRARGLGPFPDDRPDPEASGLFHYLNAGKRGATLHPAAEAGERELRRRLPEFDIVLIEGPSPLASEVRRDAALFARGTSVVCVSPFGLDGPHANYALTEIVAQAGMGLLYITGEPDRAPLQVGVPAAQYAAGQTAAAAALTAYLRRLRAGAGDFVDLSIQEAALAIMEYAPVSWQFRHEVWPRRGNWGSAAWGLYPVTDGHVGVVSGMAESWQRFRRLIGGFLLDERADDPSARGEHADAINAALLNWLEGKTKEEAYRLGQQNRLPFSYLANARDILDSAQLKARGFLVEGEMLGGRRFLMPGAPFRMEASPWRTGPPPRLGAGALTSPGGHPTESPLPMLGEGESRSDALFPPATPVADGTSEGDSPSPSIGRGDSVGCPPGDVRAPAPLAGIRVVDLSIVWAGPHCTRILGDLGAEVIKVEAARRPDLVRGPVRPTTRSGHYPDNDPGERPWDRHGFFLERNRNKLGICLDLTTDDGRAALRDLVAVSDVIIDNFSAGVTDRLGFGAAAVRAINPQIVSISMSAFGATGPEAGYAGYGATLDNLSGIVSVTGYGPSELQNLGINLSDPIVGLHAAVAVLAALAQRARTGLGQHIDLAQRESTLRFFAGPLIDYSLNGRLAEPVGNDDPSTVVQGVFPCAGEDRWLAVTVPDRAAWRALCQVLGIEGAEDEALLADRAALRERIAARTPAWDAPALMAALQRGGVPAGVAHDGPSLFEDPQLQARGFFETIDHPEAGPRAYVGYAWKPDSAPRAPARPAPRLGEHTDFVLGEILGYAPEKLARLAEQGVTENDPRRL